MFESFYLKNNLLLIKKNEISSTSCRLKGNELFKEEELRRWILVEILEKYNESIAFAPLNSPELALAYGNRSFLTFTLKKYKESILDIDRALLITDSTLTFKAKLLIRKGRCLVATDQSKATEVYDEARKIIDQIQNVEGNKLLKLLQKIRNPKRALPKRAEKLRLELPEFSRSKQISCMSDALNLEYNETYGRHLVANRNIKTGEFLMIEEAYAVVPFPEKMYTVCSFCLCPAWAGIPCDFCVFAIYCSENCKQKAWPKYHDVECFVMSLLHSNKKHFEIIEKDSATILYSLQWRIRLIVTASKEKEGSMNLQYLLNELEKLTDCKGTPVSVLSKNTKLSGQRFAEYMTLVDLNKQNAVVDITIRKIFMKLLGYLSEVEIIPPLQKQLIDENITAFNNLLNKMSSIYLSNYIGETFEDFCNCEADKAYVGADHNNKHQNFCEAKRGTFVGCISSLINHSCANNVDLLFERGKIIIYANKPIKKNEQVFRTYGITFPYHEKLQRQLYLKNRYGFICKCIACEESWRMKTTRNQHESEAITLSWMGNVQKSQCYGENVSLFGGKYQKYLIQDLCTLIDKLFSKSSELTADTFFLADDPTQLLTTFYQTNYVTSFGFDITS